MTENKNNFFRIAYLVLGLNILVLTGLVYFPKNTIAQVVGTGGGVTPGGGHVLVGGGGPACVPFEWPSGHYCILRAGGSCPAGFTGNGNGTSPPQPGWLCGDSEDDNNADEYGPFLGNSGGGGLCGGSTGYLRLCCK